MFWLPPFLLEVRAPKPTRLTFTSRDEYLTIQRPREAHGEAKHHIWLMVWVPLSGYPENDFK